MAAGSDPTVLAVDVGGTTIKAARVDRNGRTQAELTVPTGVGSGAIEKVISICRELRDESTVAAAAAVPGIVDSAEGTVRTSINLRWNSVPLAALLQRELGIASTVVHDVRAACRAEMLIGAGREASDLLMVVIGTGLSAGLVVDGRMVTGATNSAGEIGHLVVRPGGERCVCGQSGCAEVYSSAGGIRRRYVALGGDSSLSVPHIVSSGDPRAREVWTDATVLLGRALASVVVTLDPQVIVIAGGLSRAGSALLDPVRASLSAELAWREAPRVELSALTSRAGLAGASIEAWRLAGLEHVVDAWQSRHAVTAI